MSNQSSTQGVFPLLAFGASLVFALTVIITKEVLTRYDGVNSLHYAASTATVSGLLSGLLLTSYRTEILSVYKKDWRLIAGIVITSGVLGFTFLRIGQEYTSAGNAGLLSSLTSISTMIIAYFWLKESLSRKVIRLLPIFFGFLALLLLDFKEFSINFGDILILLFTVCIGLSNVMATLLVRKYNPNIITYSRFAFGGLFMFPLLFIINSDFTIWSVFTGVLTVLFVRLLYMSIKLYGPQISTLIVTVYPPFVFWYGWLVLNERLTFMDIIASSGVLITGAYIGTLKNRVEKKAV